MCRNNVKCTGDSNLKRGFHQNPSLFVFPANSFNSIIYFRGLYKVCMVGTSLVTVFLIVCISATVKFESRGHSLNALCTITLDGICKSSVTRRLRRSHAVFLWSGIFLSNFSKYVLINSVVRTLLKWFWTSNTIEMSNTGCTVKNITRTLIGSDL